MKDKPHLAEQIQPTLSALENEWEVLEVATKEKGEKLFDANRGTLYQQSIEDVDSWVVELESQMIQAETVQVGFFFLFRRRFTRTIRSHVAFSTFVHLCRHRICHRSIG